MTVHPFCIPGNHPGPADIEAKADGSYLLNGWGMVRASFHDGQWVADPSSSGRVLACPEHQTLPQKDELGPNRFTLVNLSVRVKAPCEWPDSRSVATEAEVSALLDTRLKAITIELDMRYPELRMEW